MRDQAPFILASIANTICACHMTDGFCMPRNNSACHCWKLALSVQRSLVDPHNSVLQAGWEVTHAAYMAKDKADPAKVLEAMLKARPTSIAL